MAVVESTCLVFALFCIQVFGNDHPIPNVNIRALTPTGVEFSIDGIPNINYFRVEANINRPLKRGEYVDISFEVLSPVDGIWVGKDESPLVQVGDVIYYQIQIGITRGKPFDINDRYEIQERPKTCEYSRTTSSCKDTITMVNTRLPLIQAMCPNNIIFEDDFNGNKLQDHWTNEHFIPSAPDYPFVSYQRLMAKVKDGHLRIEPKLQHDLPAFDRSAIFTGKLDLTDGCTRPDNCEFEASGPRILPPVASGRVTTSNAFALKYGQVEVKAKVPIGDWLFTDIYLENLSKCYGSEQDRILRIAGIRGNTVLLNGQEECGNRVLSGGPMLGLNCRNDLLKQKLKYDEWGNDFHVYSIRWTPDLVTLEVDGERWARINMTSRNLENTFTKDKCMPVQGFLRNTVMGPFDNFFGITISVSVGGILEFPDSVVTASGTPKPWKNTETKARLNYFNSLNSTTLWQSTSPPVLLVDYVRVRAL